MFLNSLTKLENKGFRWKFKWKLFFTLNLHEKLNEFCTQTISFAQTKYYTKILQTYKMQSVHL